MEGNTMDIQSGDKRIQVTMSYDEMMTLYFALRSERDMYIEDMLRSPNHKRFRAGEGKGRAPMVTDDHPINYRYDHIDGDVRMDADLQLKGDNSYEDLMFLHHKLYELNQMLFNLDQFGIIDALQVD